MNFTRTTRYAINPDQISFIDFGAPEAETEHVMVVMGTHALMLTGDDAIEIRAEFPEPAPKDALAPKVAAAGGKQQ